MDTIFQELVDQYRQFRTFTAWYEFSTNEIKSFVENVKQQIAHLQAEHDSRIVALESSLDGIDDPAAKATAEAELAELRAFPARVVDCEVTAFEITSNAVKESAVEVHRCRMSFCDAFAAATAELKRIRGCYTADSRKGSHYAETFEKVTEMWEETKDGEFLQEVVSQ